MNKSIKLESENVLKESSLIKIFLVSALCLFFELLVIRWVSTEINIFAYLQNSILIICFLGIGLGCLKSSSPIKTTPALEGLAILSLLMTIPITRDALRKISPILALIEDFVVWNRASLETSINPIVLICIALLLVFLISLLLLRAFIPIGQQIGKLLNSYKPIAKGYSVNVFASLIGSWTFVAFSYFSFPPFIWFLTFILLFHLTFKCNSIRNYLCSFVILFCAYISSNEVGAEKTVWSLYQKLTLFSSDENKRPNEKLIKVNNCDYQAMLNLAGDSREPDGEQKISHYDLPFLIYPGARSALLLGAGSGNDAAAAIRAGLRSITAVEIDNEIVKLGKEHHPERPYDSPHVRIINDDAREFLGSTDEKFDIVSFGLLDSHTTGSVTNTRLDHYVYTQESIRSAHRLLQSDGILVLTFEAQKPYIIDRMAKLLSNEFGKAPFLVKIPYSSLGWGGVVLIAGELSHIEHSLKRNSLLAEQITKWQQEWPIHLNSNIEITTDNWPYIYLEAPKVPILFILIAILILALFFYASREQNLKIHFNNWRQPEWLFFLFGAAFMLLEVQSINLAAVALGSTWWVTGVVISGILLMVLLANFIYLRVRLCSNAILFTALLLACLFIYNFDISALSNLPQYYKIPLVAMIVSFPMLFSGIIFIHWLDKSANKGSALAINLFGSVLGGLLQALTFLTGIKFIILIVALFYLLSMYCAITAPKTD